ncbi:MAG: type II toxin-antitoxin system VapC family toxin [Acidobacteria bacterium]|nr:type II toxin-antitoxin system VapC family toxin [Acidobacteriota bacterium]
MNGWVVDASVAVKWLVSEEFSREASGLLEGNATLLAPELLFAEATNALWAMCRRGDIGREDLAGAVALLRRAPVATPVPMRQLASAASQLSMDLEHPTYDCFYLALALQERYPVVTADMRFLDRVQGHPYLADSIRHIGDIGAS